MLDRRLPLIRLGIDDKPFQPYTERMSYTYTAHQTAFDQIITTDPLPPVISHGSVYTKRWVIDLMLDQAGVVPEADLAAWTMIEPASGDGAFVSALAERLVASCLLHGHDIGSCADTIIAYELSQTAAERSRRAVAQCLIGKGISITTADLLSTSWVREGDYLLNASRLPKADLIIGNPPYVRVEEIDPKTVKSYRSRYSTMVGRADLYVAFYEAALTGLKTGGRCAFICADRWMLNQYGSELRRLVTTKYAVDSIIEMHTVPAFEDDVSAYPAVTVIRLGPQRPAVVARAERGIENVATFKLTHYLEAVRQGIATQRLPELRAARVEDWFLGNAPWPVSSPERLSLLKRLEAEFHPLESSVTGTRVGIGVATGADSVFITKDDSIAESNRLLPLVMAADTRNGFLKWSGHFLVNPWERDGLASLSRNPVFASYIKTHDGRLRSRHIGKKNVHSWYRTIDRVDLSLTDKSKLLIPDIKERLNPVLDRGEYYPHHNLYWVTSSTWDLEVLGGLLLSDIAQFFVECYGVRMRGGYLRFQAQYLRRIRVPSPEDISPDQANALRAAFAMRDQKAATAVAFAIYGIDALPVGED